MNLAASVAWELGGCFAWRLVSARSLRVGTFEGPNLMGGGGGEEDLGGEGKGRGGGGGRSGGGDER